MEKRNSSNEEEIIKKIVVRLNSCGVQDDIKDIGFKCNSMARDFQGILRKK